VTVGYELSEGHYWRATIGEPRSGLGSTETNKFSSVRTFHSAFQLCVPAVRLQMGITTGAGLYSMKPFRQGSGVLRGL
jgi:hypothetical protein